MQANICINPIYCQVGTAAVLHTYTVRKWQYIFTTWWEWQCWYVLISVNMTILIFRLHKIPKHSPVALLWKCNVSSPYSHLARATRNLKHPANSISKHLKSSPHSCTPASSATGTPPVATADLSFWKASTRLSRWSKIRLSTSEKTPTKHREREYRISLRSGSFSR